MRGWGGEYRLYISLPVEKLNKNVFRIWSKKQHFFIFYCAQLYHVKYNFMQHGYKSQNISVDFKIVEARVSLSQQFSNFKVSFRPKYTWLYIFLFRRSRIHNSLFNQSPLDGSLFTSKGLKSLSSSSVYKVLIIFLN